MVMEEEPSPEYVGREFVRQYYNVLHACPENLHRFYSTDSSFVHAGLEQTGESTRVAKGQAEIHKRVMSLNLRECRAKIRQVDSFETVNGALVIQVIGELANSGESMRRFVQTFVLVQQSPKSYYVNNDIFRYQDDVFRDEESEQPPVPIKPVASKQRADDAMEASSFPHSQDHHVPSSGNDNYANGNWQENDDKKAAHHPPAHAPTAPFSQQQNATRVNVEAQQPMQVDQQSKQQRSSQRNERDRLAASNAAPRATSPVNAKAESAAPVEPETAIPVAPPKEAAANKPAEHVHEPRAAASSSAPSKPLTFAAVAGGGRTSPTANTNSRQVHASASQKVAPKQSAPAPRDKSPEHSAHGSVSGGDENDAHAETRHGNAGGRGGKSSAYPNEQQVFVGNLPQDVTDDELLSFMQKFGSVAEVKIVNKGNRQQGGRVTPAFAFVTFENAAAIDNMMAALPITDFRGHTRLNIERKQERDRERTNFYQGGQGGNYRGGQQSAGGRGGMRGGAPGRRFPTNNGPRGGDRQ